MEEAKKIFLAKHTLNLDNEERHIGFADACDEYLEWLRIRPKPAKPQTITSYKKYINILKIAIKNIDITTINSLFLIKILNEEKNRKKRGYGNKENETIGANTLHHEYSMLSILFNRFHTWKWINSNPMSDIEAPEFESTEVEIPEYEEFSDIEAKIMTEAIRERLQFLYGLYAGMRSEEVAGQHIDRDINFERKTVSVNTVIVRDEDGNWIEDTPKSKKSIREIPVPPEFFDVYNEYLKYRENYINFLKIKNPHYKEIPNLFLNKDGDFYRPPRISRMWSKFCRKEGININIHFHGLRHYYVSNQANYNDALSDWDLQDLAGHSDIRTTRRYIHSSKKRINQNATKIFHKFSKDSLFKSGYDTLTIPTEHIVSIIIEKVGLSNIDDLKITLETLSNQKVDYYNISEIMNKSKSFLTSKIPALGSLERLKYEKLSNEEILEKAKKQFGSKVKINILD